MPQNDKIIEGVGRAYHKGHLHLERMLENLTDENLQTNLPGTKESLSRVFQHIINAECYWLEQMKEPHPEMVKRPDPATVRSALEERGVETEARVVESEDVAPTIMEQLVTLDAEVVVIGSHGQGLFQGLLGSIGTKIVRRSPRPVLLLRSATP